MAEALSSKEVVTRKAHRCFGCDRVYPAGTKMELSANAEDGSVWNCYLCDTCRKVAAKIASDGWLCYGRGELRDAALEMEAEEND